jgi:four helix bundle protein
MNNGGIFAIRMSWNRSKGMSMERVNILETKSKAFALRIVRLYQYLRSKRESVLSKQILRSGTSIGANIAEGKYAQSKDDFINKNSVALKEAAETLYWLDLLIETKLLVGLEATDSLKADCEELIRILTSSIKTAKRK